MKKTHKKWLGILGLVLVSAMTVFAAFLPDYVSAATSVVDSVTVRVVGGVPYVYLTKPKDEANLSNPKQTIKFNYENVETVTIKIKYTDPDGVEHEYTLPPIDATEQYGEGSIELDLSAEGYGYGDYVIEAIGRAEDGVTDGDSISFSYYPVVTVVDDDEKSGEVYATVEYDEDDEEIAKIKIDVYDEDGNFVESLSPEAFSPPKRKVEIPFGKDNPAGRYKIVTTLYGSDGAVIGEPYATYYDYDGPIEVPNTGGLFNNLNVAKSDYLVTGVLIFFIVGVSGMLFIKKGKKKDSRKRR